MPAPHCSCPRPLNLEFSGEIWFWKGLAPWYFVTVPEAVCRDLETTSAMVSYGWDTIPATAPIGKTGWATSLFPKDRRYIVPMRAGVRKGEGLGEGDTVTVRLNVNF